MTSGGTARLERLDPASPAGPQLLANLRARIVRTELKPGARLTEQEIATAYGVSRQPVREAFIRLAEEGLLEIRPQRGTFVRKISVDEVRDARFVREAVEGDIVRLAAGRVTPRLMHDLTDLIARQDAVAEGDAASFMRLDEAFHRAIAIAADKARAWSVLELIKAQVDRVRHLTAREFPKAVIIAQHTAIVDALGRGDPDQAEEAMRLHLRKILSDLPAIVAAHPTFFEERDTDARAGTAG